MAFQVVEALLVAASPLCEVPHFVSLEQNSDKSASYPVSHKGNRP